jgi:hypothetical protein
VSKTVREASAQYHYYMYDNNKGKEVKESLRM